jgi:replicative DNA helicase
MSVQAETAVLSASLLSDKAADIACDLLDSTVWQRDAHLTVFDAIRQLRHDNVRPDGIAVTNLLAKTGKLDHVGGAVAISDLEGSAPPGLNVEYWCRIVLDTARRRQVAQTLDRARAQLAEADDVDGLVEDITAQLSSGPSGRAVVNPSDIHERFTVRVTEGVEQTGWKLPWRALDFFRIPENGLTIVTGLPGSGKSTWLDVTLVGIMRRTDVKVAFFSPEMSPADNHLHELVRTWVGGTPGSKLDEAHVAAADLLGRCWWIDDDRDSTPSGVLATARRLVRDHGVNVLVVDPYNNLEPDRGGMGDRQDLYIQALLRRLRRFARTEGVAVVVVAHPRRTERIHNTDAVYKTPTAGDISGGQEWWNAADLIVSVWRNQSGEEPENFGDPRDVQVTVSKCRFARWGRLGRGRLRFDDVQRRYA